MSQGLNKNYLIAFLTTFSSFFLIYGYKILRLGLAGDEMWDLSEPCWQLYVAQGRWVIPLYRWLTSTDQMVPFAYGIAAGGFYSGAVVLQAHILRLRTWRGRMLFIGISLGILQINNLMSVAWMQDCVCLGILLISFSYYLLRIWKRKLTFSRCVWVVLIGIFAASTYQTVILVFMALLGGDLLLNQHNRWAFRWKKIILVIFSIVFGFYAVKLLMVRAMLHFFHESQVYISCVYYYHGYLMSWSQNDFWEHASIVLNTLFRLLGGADSKECWFYGATLIPLLMLIRYSRRNAYRIIIAILIYLLPFSPIVLMGDVIGTPSAFTRLYTSEPLSAAILWVGVLHHIPPRFNRLVLRCVVLLFFVLILKGSYIVSDLAFIEKRTYDFSVRTASEIRIHARLATRVPQGVDINSIPIVVVGGVPFHGGNTRYDDKGTRFFNGFLFRSHSFDDMTFICCRDMNILSRDPFMKRILDLPEYPKDGCSVYIDGVIYVRCPNPSGEW